jgi:hypothetical protein
MQNRFGPLRSALTQSVRRAWAARYTSRSYHPTVLAKRHQGRAAAAVRWREPTPERGLFENFVEEAHLICSGSIDRRRSRGSRTHTLSDCCSATSDLFLFNEGRHFELAKCLGAQRRGSDDRRRRSGRSRLGYLCHLEPHSLGLGATAFEEKSAACAEKQSV